MPYEKYELEMEAARKFEAPPELPVYDPDQLPNVSYIGRTNYKRNVVFGIKREDRKRHMYVIGKTGSGKTKLLELLIRPDIYYHHGICVIDPHGDLIEDLLNFIPKQRVEDVVLLDPTDKMHAFSFNPFKNVPDEFKYHVTEGLIETFQKQFGGDWSPKLEHTFRFTCLALLEYPDATLEGIQQILTNRYYRQDVIKYIQDDIVKRFWSIEFAGWSEKYDAEAVSPLVNKIGQFLANPVTRYIFGQPQNKINLFDMMNQNKIILVPISKGKLGERISQLIGSIFLTRFTQSAMERAYLPPEKRSDFYLYVDEFQVLSTEIFSTLFSESRKYGLNIFVSHQHAAQISPSIRHTVLGNVATIISFRISAEDAESLEKEFQPVFTAKDMINLGVREFYMKMPIDHKMYHPFSAETISVERPKYPSSRDQIISYSRAHYYVPIERVLEERRLLLQKTAAPTEKEEEIKEKQSDTNQHEKEKPKGDFGAPEI